MLRRSNSPATGPSHDGNRIPTDSPVEARLAFPRNSGVLSVGNRGGRPCRRSTVVRGATNPRVLQSSAHLARRNCVLRGWWIRQSEERSASTTLNSQAGLSNSVVPNGPGMRTLVKSVATTAPSVTLGQQSSHSSKDRPPYGTELNAFSTVPNKLFDLLGSVDCSGKLTTTRQDGEEPLSGHCNSDVGDVEGATPFPQDTHGSSSVVVDHSYHSAEFTRKVCEVEEPPGRSCSDVVGGPGVAPCQMEGDGTEIVCIFDLQSHSILLADLALLACMWCKEVFLHDELSIDQFLCHLSKIHRIPTIPHCSTNVDWKRFGELTPCKLRVICKICRSLSFITIRALAKHAMVVHCVDVRCLNG
uniref:C2H2-type domain-containing protein n=1 Tax=Trichuris muris TaxID=70415 RepID=A0A5S6QHR1_TRIMR